MGWWLKRLPVDILASLRLTVNLFSLRLTEINNHCLKKLKIYFNHRKTFEVSGPSPDEKV